MAWVELRSAEDGVNAASLWRQNCLRAFVRCCPVLPGRPDGAERFGLSLYIQSGDLWLA